ncbi:Methionyl-tRNA formyltransferase [Magnetospirillum sp. LM-5]|uniref:formyl transferase n=1 Tax=Magnetospirillum sp. LM-5 TaxID=2681466 RepID=UPI00137D98FA|nr:formyl transferase [Magnetospirillum sp. LM-5]CAA7621434.1 Methionyl-tRNA formyltransferase [Magnetospirillum sp. LM-5]
MTSQAKKGLRILVCTKRDLAGAMVLNQVLAHLAGDQVMVLLSDKTRPVENAVPELAEIKFLERDLPIDTIFPLIDATGDDTCHHATFDGLARRYGIPIQVVADINGPEGESLVRAFAPDIILSARFSLIFKPNIFEIPPLGTYNVHPGALPRYAGLFAPFRCMLDGAKRIGCTLHQVDRGIDTGPIAGIGWIDIDPARSLLWHVTQTYRPGLELFFQVLDGLREGRQPVLTQQDRSQRAYGSLPGADSFKDFAAKGLRIYDPADYLEELRSFVPEALHARIDHLAHTAAKGVGASCCCGHA